MENKVIAISRQFGSGGRAIGKKVAEELDIPFYDLAIIEMAAERSGAAYEDLLEVDEKRWAPAGISLRMKTMPSTP